MDDYLYKAQRQFLNLSANKKFLLSGRQGGKTTTLCFRAIEAAVNDYDVIFLAPMQEMCYEANKSVRNIIDELKEDYGLSVTLTKDATNEISFKNRGSIKFQTPSMGDYYNEDMMILEEALRFGPDVDQPAICGSWSDKQEVLAAGTPENGMKEMDFYTPQFEVMPMSTMSNPNVDRKYVEKRREEMGYDRFRRTFLAGPIINDHWLSITEHGGERTIECPLCGFSKSIPLDFPDEKISAAEGYVFGEVQEMSCA